MVERFNGRISGLVAQTRFSSAAELESTLKSYLSTYNHSIPQRALKHQTPIQALKEWQTKKPDLFVKRVYEQSGLDKYQVHGTILGNGVKYDNRFCSIIKIENRKVVYWRDYMDSLAAWNALTAPSK